MTAFGDGYDANQAPSFKWSVEVAAGGLSRDSWLPEISSLVSNEKTVTFKIPNYFTEKVTDNTTLRFNV